MQKTVVGEIWIVEKLKFKYISHITKKLDLFCNF